MGEAISTTWKPGFSGMPTTSKGRGSLLAALGSSSVWVWLWPSSSDSMRVCTQCLSSLMTGGSTFTSRAARLRSTL